MVWRPVRDLNPCRRRERAVSWTGLDERDAKSMFSESINLTFACFYIVEAPERRRDNTDRVGVRQAAIRIIFPALLKLYVDRDRL